MKKTPRMRCGLRMPGLVLVVALAVVAFASAGDAAVSRQSGSQAIRSTSVTLGLSADYDTLDPYKYVAAASFAIDMAFYDSLVAVDPQGRVVPYLATSWTTTPTTVTMKVRTNVTCADGSALTPTDMANSLQRYFDPATAATGVSIFGKGPFTVNVSGDTLTVHSGTPSGALLTNLADVLMICPAGLKNPASLATQPDGSGPYVLTSSQRGSSYTLTRRQGWTWGPQYAGVSAAKLPDTLIYKVVTNNSTTANLLLTGGLDIGSVSGSEVARLKADSGLTLKPLRDFGETVIQYNEAPGHVTDSATVRRLLAEAISRTAWTKASSNGLDYVSTSLMPTNMPCFDPASAKVAPKYEPAAARAGFLRAGWKVGAGGRLTKGGKPLSVKIIGWVNNGLGPDYVQAALDKIGVKATLAKTDIGTYVQAAQSGNFDISILPNQQLFPEQAADLGYYFGPGGKGGANWGLVKNPVAQKWFSAAQQQTGCTDWVKAQEALLKRTDAAPLASQAFDWFVKKGNISFEGVGATVFPSTIQVG